MRFEVDTFGLTDAQKKLAKLEQDLREYNQKNGLSPQGNLLPRDMQVLSETRTEQTRLDKLKEQEAIEKKIAELRREAEEFGKSDAQKRLDAIKQMAGASRQQIAIAIELQKRVDAMAEAKKASELAATERKRMAAEAQRKAEEREKHLQSVARKAFEDSLTDREKAQQKHLVAGELFKQGRIDSNTRDRLQAGAFLDLRKAEMDRTPAIGALERGSQAASLLLTRPRTTRSTNLIALRSSNWPRRCELSITSKTWLIFSRILRSAKSRRLNQTPCPRSAPHIFLIQESLWSLLFQILSHNPFGPR